MTASDENRSEYRLADAITVFIETSASPSGEPPPVKVSISETVDVSANGLQVTLDVDLPAGSVLPLCVECARPRARFNLTGEVMWVRPSPGREGLYLVGFRILENDQTDLHLWKQQISLMLEQQGS